MSSRIVSQLLQAAKVSKLQLLFNNAGVDPSLTAEGAKQQNVSLQFCRNWTKLNFLYCLQDLPPEVMKMLEDAMKKKDAKKKEITTKVQLKTSQSKEVDMSISPE